MDSQQQEPPVLSFEESLALTKGSAWKSMGWQKVAFVMMTVGILSVNPIQLGMQFLEKEPNKFECRKYNPLIQAHQWQPCTKAAICKLHKTVEGGQWSRKDSEFRPITTDPEYLFNWVDKLSLLCETQKKVGFLGSSYFIGILCGMLFVPALSDYLGRKALFCLTMLASIIGQLGLIRSESLGTSTMFMILIGMTWPGKRVTGLNYILEFIPEQSQKNYITIFTLFDYPSILLISLCYEYVTQDWYPQQLLGVILSSICLAYCLLVMPESPKFLYVQGRYQEARQIMLRIAKANASAAPSSFMFDKEAEALAKKEEREDEEHLISTPSMPSTAASFSVEEEMSSSTFYWNIVKMTIMWSAVSFSTYLLHFQLKYLEGNIFKNNNYCAISDAIAVMFGGYIFSRLGLRATYFLAFIVSIIGGVGIVMIEHSHQSLKLGTDGSEKERQLQEAMFMSRMPLLIFVAKFGVAIGFLTSYFACFTDNTIFPISKRATAIGFCNLVARGLTGLAPMINEFAEPLPMVIFVVITSIALVNTLSLSTETPSQRLSKGDKKLK